MADPVITTEEDCEPLVVLEDASTGAGQPNPIFKGFLFGRPDTTANPQLMDRLYSEPGDPKPTEGWGAIITPDEFRMIYMMGLSRIVTVNGAYMDNEMIRGLIDQTALVLGEEIQHDIYPRLWRHRAVNESIPRNIENFANWDDPYDFMNQNMYGFHQIKLRRKPLARLISWGLYNPFSGQLILDLKHPGLKAQYETGIIRSVVTGAGPYSSNAGVRQYRLYSRGVGNQSVPGSYYVDYVSGYDRAERVPMDLREIVAKVLCIKILSTYGEGLVGGLANFSISVGILSESVGTTMSAENAFFGARIKQLRGEIKEWMATSLPRYRGMTIAIL